jgi:RimJ/RimL family protein N-acetyltransferase
MLQDRKSGALLGSLSATPSEHRVELGYLMARDFWGRGFMTEAVEVVTSWWLDSGGAHRVWAVCDVENRASARVLEKAGFMLEGTLRKWSRQPNMGDEPRDVLCFSRIRE